MIMKCGYKPNQWYQECVRRHNRELASPMRFPLERDLAFRGRDMLDKRKAQYEAWLANRHVYEWRTQ